MVHETTCFLFGHGTVRNYRTMKIDPPLWKTTPPGTTPNAEFWGPGLDYLVQPSDDGDWFMDARTCR